jgi:hypothetical protein
MHGRAEREEMIRRDYAIQELIGSWARESRTLMLNTCRAAPAARAKPRKQVGMGYRYEAQTSSDSNLGDG